MSVDLDFLFDQLLNFEVIIWITNFSNSTIWMPTVLFDVTLFATELALHLFMHTLSFWFPLFFLFFHFYRWLFIVSFQQIHFYSMFFHHCWFFSNQYCLRFVGQMQSTLFNYVFENHWHCLLLFGFDKPHN
uniref:Uncharacterized protein n=1 Tax=Meloidogyne incognita TaxID=6306 RepID=A0A914LJ32_MELIC